MCLVNERINGIACKKWDGDVGNVAEGFAVVSAEEFERFINGLRRENILTPESSSHPPTTHAYLKTRFSFPPKKKKSR